VTKLNYKFQYEEWHQDTEESRNSDVAASADFINLHGLWPKNKDANILDVGCGMGRFLLAFRGNGYANLSGIDVDDYQIGIAKKEGLDVNLVDATKFFGHNKKHYDLITMIDCLEHIEKDEQVDLLSNINKNLNDGGMLVIRVPNALSPTFGYFRYIDFTHKLSYTPASLTYLLKNAAFDHISFRPAWQENEEIAKLKKPFAELLKAEFGIDGSILTSNIVVIACKSEKALHEYLNNAPKLEVKY